MEGYYKINFVEKFSYVRKDIIRKIPYFNHMIEGCENDFEEINVPRMGFLFDHVLAYYISPLYPYPVEYYDELDFYDIQYDKHKLFDKNKQQLDYIENIVENTHRNTVITKLVCWCSEPTINSTYIICSQHRNEIKCQHKFGTSKCFLKDTEYNYCPSHCNYDVYNTNYFCKSIGCGMKRIKNKYYCYIHNDKN